jgi:hypothetical protein
MKTKTKRENLFYYRKKKVFYRRFLLLTNYIVSTVLNYLLLYDQINKTGKENLQKVESSICSILKQLHDFVVHLCSVSSKEKIQMVEVVN